MKEAAWPWWSIVRMATDGDSLSAVVICVRNRNDTSI